MFWLPIETVRFRRKRSVGVSLQMAIMKVLSGHPDGCATLADLNADLAILNAVADWTSRMRRLAQRRPGLDIFSQGIVVRNRYGWTLTAKGFQILDSLERSETSDSPTEVVELISVPATVETSAEARPLPRAPPAKRFAARRLRMAPRRRGEHGLDRSA
jgi:hypothetical protein